MSKIKVLLADDHQIVRMGLTTVIRLTNDLTVVGEAMNGEEAVHLAQTLKPDVIVMDLMMPVIDGADATVAICRKHPDAKILILTTFSTSERVMVSLDAGALGAIVKDLPHTEILDAIRHVAAGERVVSPDIANNIAALPPNHKLSARKIQILRYIAKGLTTKDIGRIIGIGPDCVNSHLRTIFACFNVSTRSEAVAFAMAHGIISI